MPSRPRHDPKAAMPIMEKALETMSGHDVRVSRGPGADVKLGLGKKKPGAEMDEDMAEMGSTAKEDAASAIFDAIDSRDGAALADAFQTMYDLCASGSDETEEYEEEESAELEM